MTLDGMPLAGRYSEKLKDVYVITGFNKWGMANSMVCAEIIRDLILGKKNEYAQLFSPQRKIKGCFKDLLINILTKVVRYKGKRRAVYRDENGKIHAIGRMCPHMHGELEFNCETKTWDCPCHGSRFDIYGNIISEPSAKHCKYFKEN